MAEHQPSWNGPLPPRSRGRRISTHDIALAGLLAAMLCTTGWVALPLGEVPVTLQTFVVVLCALLLSPLVAVSAVSAYVLLGAVGVPVFAGGTSGVGVLVGPTGGYIAGFILGAGLGSLVRGGLRGLGVVGNRARDAFADVPAATVCLAAVYALGTVRLAAVTGVSLTAAAVAGVLPFLAADAAKSFAAAFVASTVRRSARTR